MNKNIKKITIQKYINFLIKQFYIRNIIKILSKSNITNFNIRYFIFINNFEHIILWKNISSDIYYFNNPKKYIYNLNNLILLLQNTQLQLLLICRFI